MAENSLDSDLGSEGLLVRAEASAITWIIRGSLALALLGLIMACAFGLVGVPYWWAPLGFSALTAAPAIINAVRKSKPETPPPASNDHGS